MAEPAGLRLLPLPGTLAVCRLEPTAAVPVWAEGGFTSVTRTKDELSVVCYANRVPAEVRAVRDWKAWRVAGTLEFSMVGVLASLAGPLANDGVSIFVMSTFDTDYLLVREPQAARAIASLRAAGIGVSD